MKSVISVSRSALALLVLAAFVATACALTPGPTVIIECPVCKKPLQQSTIGSGNMFGAKQWTDGKVDAPMFPVQPALVKCPDCQKLFWVADAKQLGELGWGDEKSNWANAKAIRYPEEEDYLSAANAAGLSRSRELNAREQAWWLANDTIRSRAGRTINWSGARLENLQKLSALLNDQKASELILKAEISRELGQFEVCTNLLARPVGEKDCECENYAEFVRHLASEKKSEVEPLPPVHENTTGEVKEPLQQPAPSLEGDVYSVREGDTFSKIAREKHVILKALIDANPRVDPLKLQIGQKLNLPKK